MRMLATAAVLVAVLVEMAVFLPTPAFAAPDRCGWLPAAIRLARSVESTADPQAAGIREQLRALGVAPDTPVPADCGPLPRPDAALPEGGTVVCGKTESAPTPSGDYEVQNNVWGSDEPQCVRIFDTGFEVLDADHDDNGGVAAYPSIWSGCWHGTCTDRTALPKPVAELGEVTSSWAVRIPDDQVRWNAAYDLWFSPTASTTGEDGTELMIWLDHEDVAPIGEPTATATIGGIDWTVWTGSNGGVQVISYVAVDGLRRVVDLPLHDFMADAIARDALEPDWSLACVQAGFEPWSKGAGLATTAFEVTGVTL